MAGREPGNAKTLLDEARREYKKQNRAAIWVKDRDGQVHLKLQLHWHGYLIWARLYPEDGHIVLKDEWGQTQEMPVSQTSLDTIISWTQDES